MQLKTKENLPFVHLVSFQRECLTLDLQGIYALVPNVTTGWSLSQKMFHTKHVFIVMEFL